MQAGWEQATSNAMTGLAGLNRVYEAVGMHASLPGFCVESLILRDDMPGQSLRCVRGMEPMNTLRGCLARIHHRTTRHGG